VESVFEDGTAGKDGTTVYVSATINQRNFKGVLFDTTGLGQEGDGTTLEQVLSAHLLQHESAGFQRWELKPARKCGMNKGNASRKKRAMSVEHPKKDVGSIEHRIRERIKEIGTRVGAKPRVIVIGAGLSGLCCARELLHLGFEVVVVEANDRVGGRCWTRNCDGVNVDCGAGWVHGTRNNPLTKLCRDNGIEMFNGGSGHLMPLYDCSGTLVPHSTDVAMETIFNDALNYATIMGHAESITEVMYNKYRQVLSKHRSPEMYGRSFQRRGHPPKQPLPLRKEQLLKVASGTRQTTEAIQQVAFCLHSMCEVIELMSHELKTLPHQSLGESIVEYFQDTLKKPKPLDRRLFNWHCSNLEYANATNLDQLSLQHWNQDDPFTFKGPHSLLRPGFGYLAESIAKSVNYAGGKILLGHEVGAISVGKPKSANVTGKKGDKPFELKGEVVVVTIPLGVLKTKQICFSPEMPYPKRLAVERLGFGTLDKVYLRFDAPFWDQQPVMGHVSEVAGEHFQFVNLLPVTGTPALLSLVSGRFAEALEKGQNDQIVKDVMAVLRRMYKNKAVPDPVSWYVTRWKQNRFSRGSYSYIRAGSTPEDIDNLAAPMADNTIFFAGEATSKTHLASAHGAVLSGREVAKVIGENIL